MAVDISCEMGRQLNQGLRLDQGKKTEKGEGGKHMILLSAQSFNLGTVYFTKWSKKVIWIPFYVWQKWPSSADQWEVRIYVEVGGEVEFGVSWFGNEYKEKWMFVSKTSHIS